ncbi:MAG: D-glycero-beta-D-manno-heptose 1,7-bisphosphate 7-phosphatase [Desulfobacterales bacterium]|jgi:D-glycero-D-manno-heptose 1,7-bisphosphate phosphatase|nr:D-glycero-beta-D-manno-heptose 1,7-bisphosphate 7-phosphatase [Desulfobacteraceae bacterium]MBT7085262.1 D-glycero-beta-D-manno-heptose 1,7-bisphosphate 7-phosphatase [Desulfobacterales bacterium]MBT7696030.1 D-glycero-beta-D-manno-heptose 1,7-bisphosphate 7-phosphatase [Desulfobacterales bacterium]
MGNEKNKRIIFLDRDGVINHDSKDYIKNPSEFNFISGSPAAIRKLNENSFEVIVITNQSAVNRKMVTIAIIESIFSKMKSGIKDAGGIIKDIFYCPHIPEENCNCRKPMPGMIHAARKKYNIDLESSYMIGDSVKDIECAKKAGCGMAILVLTGNGIKSEKILIEKNILPDHVAENLLKAAEWIISQQEKR